MSKHLLDYLAERLDSEYQRGVTRALCLRILANEGREPPEPTGDADADYIALLRATVPEKMR